MISSESILGLNQLKIIGQREEHVDGYDEDFIFLTCESTNPRPRCPYCHSLSNHSNQSRPKKIRDIDISGKHTILEIYARNYECLDCGKTYTEELDMIEPGDKITKRLRNELGRKSLNNTFDYVASMYGISHTTVRQAFILWVKEQNKEHDKCMYAPRVLGIDECHLSPEGRSGPDDGMRGVFVDVENVAILDMTENRYKDTIIERLSTFKNPENLQIVTIDMWEGYKNAVYETFGNKVKVVVDHYHVTQELMIRMFEVKNNLTANMEPGTLKKIKNYQSLLRTNIEDLDDEMKMELNRLFKAVDGIKEAYALKESFRAIYNCKTSAEAKEAFEKWCQLIPEDERYNPYRSFANTVNNWYTEIFNFFDCERFTNSATESLNNIIKKVNRAGNGYSFEMLRAKILYGAGRKAYKSVKKKKEENNKIPGSMGLFISTIDSYKEFGVDMKELEQEIDSGEFFKENES